MEVQIVIFLAFVSVTLVFNSLVVWFAYKAFANVTMRVTDTVRELHASQSAWAWLRSLESASTKAISITEIAKDQIGRLEPVLETAQSRFSYGLAKVDVRVEDFCDNICLHAEKAQGVILAPAHRIGQTMSGVHEVLRHVTRSQSGDDASATPTK